MDWWVGVPAMMAILLVAGKVRRAKARHDAEALEEALKEHAAHLDRLRRDDR